MKNYKNYMTLALKEALKGAAKDEVPIGAVVVDSSGKVVSRAHNKTESKKSQLEHAEILAIVKATKKIGDWRLDGFSIYVTLEPCLMCMAVISMHRINKVIFGADSKLYGFSKNDDFFNSLTCAININSFELVKGILEKESKEILQSFFRNKRKLKKGI